MQTIATTALMGFFLLAGAGATNTPVSPSWAPIPPNPLQESYTVSMTGYNAEPGQTDDSPFTTASGAYSDADVVAARADDLADNFPYGTVIEIENDVATSSDCGFDVVQPLIGYRVIADAMNTRIHNTVDILFHNDAVVRVNDGRLRNPANALGYCKNVKVKIVGRIDINKMPMTQAGLVAMIQKGQLAVAK